MTALTLYFSNEASATIATANKLYTTSGSPANVNNATKLGTATGWGDIFAQGTTSAWAGAVSDPAPTGHGFLLDSTLLEGKDLLAGTYTASIRLNTTGVGAVAITADIHCRVFKYNSGTYTQIADTLLTNQSIKTTKTVFNPTITTTSRTSFTTGDKLYLSITCNVTANSGASTESITLSDLSTDTTTHTGMTTAQLVTPGYVATGGGAGSVNPYMVKIGSLGPDSVFPAQAITDMQALGIGGIFYQIQWSLIDQSGTTAQDSTKYHWTAWDSCMTQCNAAKIDVYIAIMFPPTQLQNADGVAVPAYMATFATQIATRYNPDGSGHNGLKIKGIYCGNEDYSHGGSGGLPADLVLAMKACYPAIKGVNTAVEVVAGGLFTRNSATNAVWWDTLLNPSTGAYIGGVFQADAVSFHWHDAQPYTGSYTTAIPVELDPAKGVPSWNGGQGIPTFAATWGIIQTKMTAYSLTGVSVYGDEIGMNVNSNPGGTVPAPNTNMTRYPGSVLSEATRAAYYQTILDSMRTSGFCTKIGFFTLGYYKGYPGPDYRDGQSLVQGPTDGAPSYRATFNAIRSYISTYPTWGAAASGTSLATSTGTLTFSAQALGSDPAAQTLTLSNSGASSAAYTASTNQSWLSVSPASGTVTAGGTITSTISCATGALAVGTYTGTVTYVGPDNSVSVSVTFTVTTSAPGSPYTPLTAYFTGESASALASYSALVLSDTPIRYYRLDESSGTTAHDLGSQAQNGTLNGGITLSQTGLIAGDSDSAMLPNGSTGYISIPTAGLPTGAAAWSAEIWLQFASVPGAGNYPVALSGGNGTNLQGFALWFDGDTQQFSFGFNGSNNLFSSITPVSGHIYYLVGTYDGVTATFYCYDATTGVSDVTSHAYTLNLTYGSADVGALYGPSLYFPGVIDEPALYSYTLSAAQVARHATRQTANLLYAVSGGSANVNTLTKIGAATGYSELYAQGTTNAWLAAGSAPAPSSNGFLLDSVLLEGNQLVAGVYSAAVRLNTTGVGAVTITADVHCRLWKWSAGTYTAIADCVLVAQSIKTTKTVFTPTFTTTSATDFGTGDKLYIDIVLNVTANSGAGTQTVTLSDLSTETSTLTGLSTAQVATPGYQASTSSGGGGSGGGGGTTAPLSVVVNNVPYTLLARSLQIDNNVGRRSTARLQLRTDTSTHFYQYQQVQITDANSSVAFNGYITSPTETKPGFQNSLVHTITCADQHYLADKRVVAATYTNKTCGFMVTDIYNTYLAAEGVQIGQIYDGPTPSLTLYPNTTLYPGGNVGLIPAATFAYCTVAQAFDALAKQASSSGIPYYWQIDAGLNLWFVPYTAVVNTVTVDGSQMDQQFRPPRVTRANSQYRNTQYLIGGYAQTLAQTEIHSGDGQTRSFPLGYQVSSPPAISVSLNGGGYSSQSVGLKGSTGSQWYWAAGDTTITQDSGQAVLRGPTTTVDFVKVVYTGQYPTVITDSNQGQITYQSSIDGSSGIVESVLQDTTITSITNGLSEASQFLTRYATQGLQLVFMTLQTGFAQGQLLTVNLPVHGLYSAQMLVTTVSASDALDGLNIWYTVTCVQGPYDTTWADFFGAMLAQQAPANSINIGLSSSVTILQNFTASIAVTATLNVSVYACPIPNTTLQPSTSLFPC